MATGSIALPEEQVVSLPQQGGRWRALGLVARRNPLGVIGLLLVIGFIVLGTIGPYIAPYEPRASDIDAQLQYPSWEHPFGTDHLGRDMLSRVIAGARISLMIGAAAVGIGVVGGSFMGILSGYYGGVVDSFVQRTGEAGAAFPGLIL
ncbi:MAG: ABC transporter permease, partial [Dehalococcoidia bacterium]